MINQLHPKITDTGSGVNIVIPARLNKRATTGILLNGIVLVFYFTSILPTMSKSEVSPALMVLVNVVLLTGLFGFFSYNLFTALWCYYGREKLSLDRTSCVLAKTIFGLGVTRRFPLDEVAAISAVDMDVTGGKPKNLLQSIGIGWGLISITCGNKKYFFGAALEEKQVHEVLEKIGKYKAI